LTQEALVLQLSAGFGQSLDPQVKADAVEVSLKPAQILNFARFARDQLGFDMLTSITAVDNVENFELLYHFASVRPIADRIDPAYPGYLLARVEVPKDFGIDASAVKSADVEPVVASITPVYPGANQQEREIWDLMGIRFKGHPKLERILLWEGFPGHPLRKDWRPLNAEIPWHLAGMTGFGGGTMADAPAEARIADDGSGISQPIMIGTTPQSFQHPHSRPARPEEVMRIKLGQNGLVDDEGIDGPGTKPLSGAQNRPVASVARPEIDQPSPADAGDDSGDAAGGTPAGEPGEDGQ
jgi:NADH:ubiquinone oxidoreductase subunit C